MCLGGRHVFHFLPLAATCSTGFHQQLCAASPSSALSSPRAGKEEQRLVRKQTEREREIQVNNIGNLIETENKSPSLIPFHLFLDQI